MDKVAEYLRFSAEAMTANQVADQLGIRYTHLRKLMETVELPTARKVGRDIIYWPPDVEAVQERLGEDRRTKEYRDALADGQ